MKPIIVLLLTLNSGLCALAADVRKSTAALQQGEVAASSIAATVVLSTGPLTPDEVIDRLEAADAALKSLHAKYRQSLRIPGYGIDQSGDGELWFEKERKLRIEQKSPKKQIVVSDGNLIWIYQAENNQVIQQSWSAFEKNTMVSRGLTQFGSYAKLREKYSVSASSASLGQDGRSTYTVTLKPKDVKDIPFTLELTVAAPDFIPTRTHMKLSDTEVTTTLEDLQVNAPIEKKVFDFEAPAGSTLLKTGPQ